ncbi:MAG TPA: COX15/CtaA family protein, partial [Candidatus Polarisedimenticolaceae bacterium]|nr:COX15/CtaA family protein [Candidatus Polarisedimenticolaceae bacterium]
MKGRLLSIGFGTAVAMWGIGYLARLPVVLAPPAVVLVLLLLAQLGGGFIAGRFGPGGARDGAGAGALTGLLNLLVLGSFLSAHDRTNALVPSALVWLPGSIAVSIALGGLGGLLGARGRDPRRAEPDWTAALARVAVAATFLLLVAGGLVTSNQAGLAVADWPSSYGYNMFLYPFARMTGGIYYEHAHRLLGALVGLTTVALAAHLTFAETRGWVKRMAYAAVVLVIAQGILGGLRVTEKNVALAVVHGVTAQVFFSLLVALAVLCSRGWRDSREGFDPAATAADRRWTGLAIGALLVQIVLGALQRHLAIVLMLHIGFAFVAGWLAISAGVRAWGRHEGDRRIGRAGLTVVYVTGAQLALGFGAWIARSAAASGALSPEWKIVLTTAHQGTGALLLASAVRLRAWLGSGRP